MAWTAPLIARDPFPPDLPEREAIDSSVGE